MHARQRQRPVDSRTLNGMYTHTETKILPYTARQMFDLVIAVDQYPVFLPWCIGARINERKAGELNADVIVGYKMFREKFTSRVLFSSPHNIEVDYLKGPLRHLQNRWTFTDRGGKECLVNFHVEFDFHSPMFQKLLDQFFDRAISKMVTAFETRAASLYK